MKFIQARHYTRLYQGPRTVQFIVLHTMENPEKPDDAEGVALWFSGPTAPQASAHYCIDNDRIVQCVREQDVAWGAPGANRLGIQLEHAGYARQTPDEWADAFSEAMLELSARLSADICSRYLIPVVSLNSATLHIPGIRGITTHAAVSEAFKLSDHTDPGPGFPMGHYLDRVAYWMDEWDPLGGLGPVQ